MRVFRYGELFAGAGGMSLGLHRAGMMCAFHAEIADFPRRVLRKRFPGVPLYGDVLTLDGRELVQLHGSIDLLAGGSPCQDLSVAGKRAGLEGARSGLFFQQMRLWDETGALYCLWENVLGALSSCSGRDFAAVLSAFVGAPVTVPRNGWRGGAGVVAGPTGVAAWRVLDAQHVSTCDHGAVPQRRQRVFVLGARAGAQDPAEILPEPQGMHWDTPPRAKAGEGATPPAPRGATSTSGVAPIAFHHYQDPIHSSVVAPSLGATTDGMGVMAFDLAQITHPENRATVRPGAPSPALNASGMVHVCNETGHESWRVERAGDSLNAHEAKEAHTLVVATPLAAYAGRNQVEQTYPVQNGAPRRLLPIECERLMGWPDGWTDVPDDNGKPASDAVRYRACGNGVAATCSQWIAERILDAERININHMERAA